MSRGLVTTDRDLYDVWADYSDFDLRLLCAIYQSMESEEKDTGVRYREPVEPIVYWVEKTVPQEFRLR